MIFDIRGMMIEIHLKNMSEYLNTIEVLLKNKQNEFKKYIDEAIKDMDEDSRQQFFEYNEGNHWQLFEVFPELLFKSFIISWYSFVEVNLFELCELIQINGGLTINLEDLAHKGIFKAKLFFTKVAHVNLINEDWEELGKVNKIRNALVHKDGRFNDTEINTLRSYFVKFNLLKERGADEEFIPNIEYCTYLIGLAKKIFTNLYYDAGRTQSRTSFEKKR